MSIFGMRSHEAGGGPPQGGPTPAELNELNESVDVATDYDGFAGLENVSALPDDDDGGSADSSVLSLGAGLGAAVVAAPVAGPARCKGAKPLQLDHEFAAQPQQHSTPRSSPERTAKPRQAGRLGQGEPLDAQPRQQPAVAPPPPVAGAGVGHAAAGEHQRQHQGQWGDPPSPVAVAQIEGYLDGGLAADAADAPARGRQSQGGPRPAAEPAPGPRGTAPHAPQVSLASADERHRVAGLPAKRGPPAQEPTASSPGDPDPVRQQLFATSPATSTALLLTARNVAAPAPAPAPAGHQRGVVEGSENINPQLEQALAARCHVEASKIAVQQIGAARRQQERAAALIVAGERRQALELRNQLDESQLENALLKSRNEQLAMRVEELEQVRARACWPPPCHPPPAPLLICPRGRPCVPPSCFCHRCF